MYAQLCLVLLLPANRFFIMSVLFIEDEAATYSSLSSTVFPDQNFDYLGNDVSLNLQ